jgi:hypothetical protein
VIEFLLRRLKERRRFLPATMSLPVIVFPGCSPYQWIVATNRSRRTARCLGLLESAQEDQEQGATLASSMCAGRGMLWPRPFGRETQQCNEVNGYGGCVHWMVTRRYQCLGSPRDVRPCAPDDGDAAATGGCDSSSSDPGAGCYSSTSDSSASCGERSPTDCDREAYVKQGDDWER